MKSDKNPAAVALGRLGGKVTGKCKSRGSEKCRAAANKRWEKVKQAKGEYHGDQGKEG